MGKKVFVFLLILFAVSTVFCNWNLEYSKEKMFGEKKWYVASSKVLPAKGHTFSQKVCQEGLIKEVRACSL